MYHDILNKCASVGFCSCHSKYRGLRSKYVRFHQNSSFSKKTVLMYKKVQQKVPSMNFVKNRRRRQAGGDTFLQMHNFIENGSIQICATKKCLT